MESPCYNRYSHEDCPNRGEGCSVTCERWADYLRAREIRYKYRKKQADAEADQFRYSQERNKHFRVNRRKQR